jgi:glutaredoxin 3
MKDIEIYTTPTCGFCHAAKRLLASKGASFREISVMGAPALRQEMMTRSGRHTADLHR